MKYDKLKFYAKFKVYNEEPSFGPGIRMLMKGVEETGSLSATCKNIDMAYSKAWRIIKRAEKDLGFRLFTGVAGGKNGGGMSLTKEGEEFLEKYDEFERKSRKALQEIFKACFK